LGTLLGKAMLQSTVTKRSACSQNRPQAGEWLIFTNFAAQIGTFPVNGRQIQRTPRRGAVPLCEQAERLAARKIPQDWGDFM